MNKFHEKLLRSLHAAILDLTEGFRSLRDEQERCIAQTVIPDSENKIPEAARALADIRDSFNAYSVGANTDGQENQRLQRKSITVQWWLFAATSLAFIAAAIYANIADRTLEQVRIQTDAAKISAEAAKSAADTAAKTLEEIRSGGKDTHDLAVAAKGQADASRAIADASKSQVDAANKLATATKALADTALDTANTTREHFVASQRPWIKVRYSVVTPLTFNFRGGQVQAGDGTTFNVLNSDKSPMALMTLERILEMWGRVSLLEFALGRILFHLIHSPGSRMPRLLSKSGATPLGVLIQTAAEVTSCFHTIR